VYHANEVTVTSTCWLNSFDFCRKIAIVNTVLLIRLKTNIYVSSDKLISDLDLKMFASQFGRVRSKGR
jgi:hypothetical protein